MRRHARIFRNQRQRWLAFKIASRQPIVARIARHQRLLRELMLPAGTSERTGILPERSFNWARQRALPLARPLFRSLLVGEAEEERAFSSVLDHLVERQGEEGSGQEEALTLVTENAENLEALTIQREDAEQPPGLNEPVEAKPKQEQKLVDERAQPIENAKTRRSRGRIQEQPVEPGNTSPTQAALPSPPSRMARRKEQETVSEEASSKEASEADDLFAPRDTDRSPQAWMARLMGAKSAPIDDVAASSTAVEGEKRIRPVGAGVAGMRGGDARVVPAGRERHSRDREEGDASVPTPLNSTPAPTGSEPPPRGHEKNLPVKAADSQPLPTASTNVARVSSEARPVSTPLSQQARRFLQPLVGIDPASVHVHRDAIAEHLADAYQADAITVGDDVAIAAGHPDDTPKTLGLLAHEFTHVARRREPRFVPPIARVMSSTSTNASMPGNMTPGRLSDPADEEALAQRVEGRVTRAAQEQVDQATASSMTLSAGGLLAETTRSVPETRSGDGSWGGLPAPWEPLPAWLMSSPVTTEDGEHAAVVARQPPQITHEVGGAESGLSGAYGGGSTWNGSGPGDTGVQRAGLERNLGEEEQTTAPMQQAAMETAKAPEPDLDVLARQVYALLKRRLEVERRRES